jgi:cytidylate kinase
MENKKIIINVGRQIGSGGRIIAKMLAEDFGCKFYDKELLNLAAKESGFSEKFFEQNDEQKGFLKSLFHVNVPLLGEHNFYKDNFSQDSLYQFQSDAIRKAAQTDSCVFVGRTADYVLRDFKNTFSVFITANIDQRLQRVCKRHNLDRAAARKYIRNREEDRASYYNYYTGKEWGHAESYDLCINSSLLGLEETEKFIAEIIRKRFNI